MPKIARTSLQLVEMARKRHHKPQKVDLDTLSKNSPAFTAPGKYTIKKDRCNMKRVQSYAPLEDSLFAAVLCAPPRMVRQCRTVVPRSLLVPMKIFKSEYFAEKSDFSHVLVPVPPGLPDKDTPVAFYYPCARKLFEAEKELEIISPISKGMIILPQFTDGTTIGKLGWLTKNREVYEKAFENALLKGLANMDFEPNQNAKHLRIVDSDNVATFYVDGGIPVVNINKVPIKEKIDVQAVPINAKNKSTLLNLLQYCIYHS